MVFKGCVRCGGDLYKEDDLGQTDLVCLQCGHRETAALPSFPVVDEMNAEQREGARELTGARR